MSAGCVNPPDVPIISPDNFGDVDFGYPAAINFVVPRCNNVILWIQPTLEIETSRKCRGR